MFTGIIQNTGLFHRTNTRVTVESAMDLNDVQAGDSIAIHGVCLTTIETHALVFDLGHETLSASTLGHLSSGARVHLEKALRLSDRLGGHLVQGHVDGIGQVVSISTENNSLHIIFKASPDILKLCIPKGSITINGVSLTINHLDSKSFSVCLIPHTLEKTTFGDLKIGDWVNLENDLIGKYILQLACHPERRPGMTKTTVTSETIDASPE